MGSTMRRVEVLLGSVIYDFEHDVKHVTVMRKLDLVRMLFSTGQVDLKI